MTNNPNFHFPKEIKLISHPLVEAWLEIRWQLENLVDTDLMTDPGFPFALGQFRAATRDDFPTREDLPASRAPLDMLPYHPRHRFRKSSNEWPVLQLGPGVATVNFVDPYNWAMFKDMALYLRSKLLEAYETPPKSELITLRYRNAFPYEYSKNDLLEYLADSLNTHIKLPQYIPGGAAKANIPSTANIFISFNLTDPKGKGSIILATGQKHEETNGDQEVGTEHVILQLEVASKDEKLLDQHSEDYYKDWLSSAHAIIHEWFFAFIDGALSLEYESGE
jgi:uncharacterized protein (TIGR04255 family)